MLWADYYKKFSEKISFGGENEIFPNLPYVFYGQLPTIFQIQKVYPR
jgi:hypothetical protein